MDWFVGHGWFLSRRSPHGERGLKSDGRLVSAEAGRRSPHGERGLKCCGRGREEERQPVALLMESVD